jgi:hypothetical protein
MSKRKNNDRTIKSGWNKSCIELTKSALLLAVQIYSKRLL